MNIQEIKVIKFPLVIFSDSHCNIQNIKKLQELYPNEQLICLGDTTSLFSKPGETFNHKSIDYFIENKIPCLKGNHEDHILGCSTGDSFVKILPKYNEGETCLTDNDIYDLTQQQIDYLRKLPIGIKLILPNGFNYYCFHNEPYDLWGFNDQITQEYLKKRYIFSNLTLGIIQGHLHKNQVDNHVNPKRIVIGQLCNKNHHTDGNDGRNYAILTENGVEFKKILAAEKGIDLGVTFHNFLYIINQEKFLTPLKNSDKI